MSRMPTVVPYIEPKQQLITESGICAKDWNSVETAKQKRAQDVSTITTSNRWNNKLVSKHRSYR